jgi:hypothetical protein
MLAAAFGPPLFSLMYIYTLLSSVMTGKKLAGVILIFIGTLGLIITFYVTFALLFAFCFCFLRFGTAWLRWHECHYFEILIGGIILLHILYSLYHRWWTKPSEIAPKVA